MELTHTFWISKTAPLRIDDITLQPSIAIPTQCRDSRILRYTKLYRLHYLVLKSTYEFLSEVKKHHFGFSNSTKANISLSKLGIDYCLEFGRRRHRYTLRGMSPARMILTGFEPIVEPGAVNPDFPF